MIYYMALPFVRVDGGLAPGEAVECPYEAAAVRRAEAMACSEACGFRRMRTVIPIDCGQRFRSIADSVPVIADSGSRRRL